MKNIKSIIVTLVITLILGTLPTTTTHATTITQPNQNATLQCCRIAYNKLLDFKTQSTTELLNPLESANVDIYDSFASTLENQGMKFSDVSDYLVETRFGSNCEWYNFHNKSN